MIQKATVRRVPRSGLGKNKRRHAGHIYLNQKWLGQSVMVIDYRLFLNMQKELRLMRIKLAQIKGLADEYFSA